MRFRGQRSKKTGSNHELDGQFLSGACVAKVIEILFYKAAAVGLDSASATIFSIGTQSRH